MSGPRGLQTERVFGKGIKRRSLRVTGARFWTRVHLSLIGPSQSLANLELGHVVTQVSQSLRGMLQAHLAKKGNSSAPCSLLMIATQTSYSLATGGSVGFENLNPWGSSVFSRTFDLICQALNFALRLVVPLSTALVQRSSMGTCHPTNLS